MFLNTLNFPAEAGAIRHLAEPRRFVILAIGTRELPFEFFDPFLQLGHRCVVLSAGPAV